MPDIQNTDPPVKKGGLFLLGVIPVRLLMMFAPGGKWPGIVTGTVLCGLYAYLTIRFLEQIQGWPK